MGARWGTGGCLCSQNVAPKPRTSPRPLHYAQKRKPTRQALFCVCIERIFPHILLKVCVCGRGTKLASLSTNHNSSPTLLQLSCAPNAGPPIPGTARPPARTALRTQASFSSGRKPNLEPVEASRLVGPVAPPNKKENKRKKKGTTLASFSHARRP